MRSALLLLSLILSSTASADVLRVDRATGRVTWENSSFTTIGSFGYEINSPSGSLNPAAWLSIAEHGDADSGGSIDPDAVWDIWASDSTSVAEASFEGLLVLRHGDVLDLGADLWRVGGHEDLEFLYFDFLTLELTPTPVQYFGTAPQFPPGDYNASGLVEQQDLDLVLGSWGNDAAAVPVTWTNELPTGNIDQDELDRVLVNWGDTRTAPATAAVPEPRADWLMLIGLALSYGMYVIASAKSPGSPA